MSPDMLRLLASYAPNYKSFLMVDCFTIESAKVFSQGLVMQAGGTDIFQAFYYVCLVSLVASYAALFLLARGVGAGRIPSAMMALLGMLAPCMHPIHLESFQPGRGHAHLNL